MGVLHSTGEALTLALSGDAALLAIIGVSLRTTLVSLAMAFPLAVAAGYWLATTRSPARAVCIWLVQTALSLPTVLIGLLLYLLLSRVGPLGNLQWLFTQPGIVAGQMLIGLPLMSALTLHSVQAVDRRIAETAIILGAGHARTAVTVLFEARFGIVAALVHGFGRVVSEVGCALMVGGNIAGETRTITTAIALETSKGEFAQGIALGLVLITIALVVNAALLLLQGQARHVPAGAA